METPALLLQGIAALTFGLAFAGLWRAFGRAPAALWAVAMVSYGAGSLLATIVFAIAGGDGRPNTAALLLAIPGMMLLFTGVGLFGQATAALAGQSRTWAQAFGRAAVWGGLGLLLVVGVGIASRAGQPGIAETLRSTVSRLIMAAGCLLAVRPLIRHERPERRFEFRFLAVVLTLHGLRFITSAALALAGISDGGGEPPVMLVLHLTVLIVLGVAVAVALVGEERIAALQAARTIRDTAEALHSTEQQFRFVVENTSDVPLLVDPGGTIRYIAPSAGRLLGVPAGELEGTSLLDLAHPDDRPRAAEALERLAREDPGTDAPPLAIRVRRRDGGAVPFEVRGRRVPDPRGTPMLVLSARDVTAVRQLETALAQSQKLESLGQMAAGVAHDFNNILTAITAGAVLARGAVASDSPAAVDLAEISRAADRGAALTRQLLTFARRQAVAPENFDVQERVHGLAGIIRRLVGPDVRLDLETSGGATVVCADPYQFDQVLLNLAANARDAMAGGGQLRIAVRSEAGRGRTVVEVEDTGPGIAPEAEARIFEPFFTTKGGRGTGLGLATAYGFARQAGGDLRAANIPGRGARLSLELPLAAVPAASPAVPAATGMIPRSPDRT